MSNYLYEPALKNPASTAPPGNTVFFGAKLDQAGTPGTRTAVDKFHGDIHSVWGWYNYPVDDNDFNE